MCTYSLPWQDATSPFSALGLSGEVEEVPPPPLEMSGPQWVLHHYKSKKPSVSTQFTFDTHKIQMQPTYHTFLVTNLLIGMGFTALQ